MLIKVRLVGPLIEHIEIILFTKPIRFITVLKKPADCALMWSRKIQCTRFLPVEDLV
jgi:hypothetical protein